LNYASGGTCIDITYVVVILSKYLDNPSPTHWEAVKHVFAYLSGTVNWSMMYGGEESDLTGFADVDGSMHEDHKAILGYAFLMDGGAVSWSLKWQEIIALSTTEVEYICGGHPCSKGGTLVAKFYW
jgi:hypothetical protein